MSVTLNIVIKSLGEIKILNCIAISTNIEFFFPYATCQIA